MQPMSRHMCFIYDGDASQQLPRILSILTDKLELGNRCLFLGHPNTVKRARNLLGTMGISVIEEEKRGSLVISDSQGHLENGIFSAEKMLQGLSDAVDSAVRDGYAGLWATGDMTWEFGSENNLEKLLKYECGLEALFIKQPKLSGICQYHKDTLPLHTLGDALLTHPTLYINHTLHRANPFYRPHDLILSPSFRLPDEATIAQMLGEFRVDPIGG